MRSRSGQRALNFPANQKQTMAKHLILGLCIVFVALGGVNTLVPQTPSPSLRRFTFQEPHMGTLFRIVLLRSIAWSAHEPIDRFNDLVLPGARVGN